MSLKFNRQQKEGVARIFDGYAIASSIAFGTFIVGRVDLKSWEVVLLILMVLLSGLYGLYLRKD